MGVHKFCCTRMNLNICQETYTGTTCFTCSILTVVFQVNLGKPVPLVVYSTCSERESLEICGIQFMGWVPFRSHPANRRKLKALTPTSGLVSCLLPPSLDSWGKGQWSIYGGSLQRQYHKNIHWHMEQAGWFLRPDCTRRSEYPQFGMPAERRAQFRVPNVPRSRISKRAPFRIYEHTQC